MTLVKNAGLVSTAPQHEFFSYGAVGAFRFDFGHASSLAFQHDEIVAQSTRQIGAGRSATRRVEPDCRAVRVLSRVDWITPRLNRRDFPIIRAADRLPTTKLVRIRTESARNLNRILQISLGRPSSRVPALRLGTNELRDLISRELNKAHVVLDEWDFARPCTHKRAAVGLCG